MPDRDTNQLKGSGERVDRRPPSPSQDRNALDVIAEAEALRAMLHDAHFRAGHLVAALKQQRRQSRALQAAVTSLRQLHLDR